MSILSLITKCLDKVEELKKNYRYYRSRKDDEAIIKMNTARDLCAGELNAIKNDLKRSVKEASANIKLGISKSINVAPHEQILKDSAIGYILVNDAIFYIETLEREESIKNAHNTLQNAVNIMSGKKKVSSNSRRRVTPYSIQSPEDSYEAAKALVTEYYDEIKSTGNIESCLKRARSNSSKENDGSGSSNDDRYKKLKAKMGTKREKIKIDTSNIADFSSPEDQ